MEAVGYGTRVASAANPSGRIVYIVQFCLVILAPVFMAGVIYLVFGRIVFHVVPAEARTFKLLWVPRMSQDRITPNRNDANLEQRAGLPLSSLVSISSLSCYN